MKSCQTQNIQTVEALEKRVSRSNRDHAKKKHRPMPEDELLPQGRRLTIAQQLEDLLTPAITAQQSYYRQLGLRDRILNKPVDGGSSVDTLVAGRSRSDRIDANVGQGRLLMVYSHSGKSASDRPKIFEFSGSIV